MEEQIARAKARVEELRILIKHWEKTKPPTVQVRG
jgi:DNA polymerase sigma